MRLFANINKIVLLILAGLALPGHSHAGGGTVVSVNGVNITGAEVDRAVARKIRGTVFHRDLSGEKTAEIREIVIDELIELELIYQDSRGKVEVSEEEIDGKLADMKKGFPSVDAYEKALEAANSTEKDLKKSIRRNLMIGKMKVREITEKAVVTEEEAREHYEKNRARYNEPEKLGVREIFVNVLPNATPDERALKKERITMIRDKVREGGDFGLLAWEYSEDKYKYKSGDIGFVHRGVLSPDIESVLWKLKEGETSGVVESIYGYYIFYLEKKLPPRQRSFDDAKESIVKELTEKKRKSLEEAYRSSLLRNADIKRTEGEGR